MNDEFLVKAFEGVSEWLYERTGLEIPKDRIRFEVYKKRLVSHLEL